MGLTNISTGEGEVFQMCTLSVPAGTPTLVPTGKHCPLHETIQCLDTYRASRRLARFSLLDFIAMRRRWRREAAAWDEAGGTSGLYEPPEQP
ncbi:hypothetical protein [Melissospora conviva]|uniref:hypothetical protein n=1 Tax=Melissospora conviva TaxID=3388432 RepID=UPI003C1A4588